MRDKRFVAAHRGGPLSKEHHQQLIRWAWECSEHLLPLLLPNIDKRLSDALIVAKEWENGKATVGEARKAALGAINAARESSDPVSIAVARSVGHAVATAHMADHSMGAALYALKAVKYSGGSVDEERKWQSEQLHAEIRDLVLSGMISKRILFTRPLLP